MDNFASLDTPGGPGGVKVVEWNQNQLIRSLWYWASLMDHMVYSFLELKNNDVAIFEGYWDVKHNFILVILKKRKHKSTKVFGFWSRIISFCSDLYYSRPIFIFNYKSSINLSIDGVVFNHMFFKTFVIRDANLANLFISFSQKTAYPQGSVD